MTCQAMSMNGAAIGTTKIITKTARRKILKELNQAVLVLGGAAALGAYCLDSAVRIAAAVQTVIG